jgi:hypothetical protein
MPFGFQAREVDIDHAINDALYKDVIVLAASSNFGSNFSVTYPARKEGVIAINATNAFGKVSDFNPSPRLRDDNFATLGEVVRVPGGSDKAVSGVSGTSIAVTVAGSIVAMILEMARRARDKIPMDAYNNLHTSSGMKSTLRLLGRQTSGYCYLTPWMIADKGSPEYFIHFMVNAIDRY